MQKNTFQRLFEFEPGREGYFGEFGGAYIPEILHETIAELRAIFDSARQDPAFWQDYVRLMSSYSCRPTPITFCENLSNRFGPRVFLKREDLNHTGAHKANNVMGQGLLVQRMGKRRVIAETGAGQHGVATATMAAKLGLECTIYMGAEDVDRQRPNVFWMEQLGAQVVTVEDGTRTLKDAINAAMRDWSASMADTHYVLGTVCGPHPFPLMVTYFQSIIGTEARQQMLAQYGGLPQRVYACVGGGSNASGIFSGFLDDAVELVGVEAGG
ncbi:MAG: tryptophan synthase subunit beta, partial [Gammaproteobacteria bacterium RIFCSPLOWO2_12_FULL_52_10]